MSKLIDTLMAGPELDWLVCQACGIKAWPPENGGIHPVRIQDSNLRMLRAFCPSTNWTDAMLAAERTELFEWGAVALFKSRNTNRWSVADVFETHHVIAAEADSGPLAICRAILKAKASHAESAT